MKLGLKRNQVKLSQYSNEWEQEFIIIKQELLNVFPLLQDRIEHIGSTAIKGMTAKPILDLAVGVDDINKVDNTVLKAFKTAGFLRLRVVRPNEIVLAKFTDETYEEKTHYLHVVDYNEDLWKNFLFFRDYLNANKTARDNYINLKNEFIQNYPDAGVEQYTDFKVQFVNEINSKRKA